MKKWTLKRIVVRWLGACLFLALLWLILPQSSSYKDSLWFVLKVVSAIFWIPLYLGYQFTSWFPGVKHLWWPLPGALPWIGAVFAFRLWFKLLAKVVYAFRGQEQPVKFAAAKISSLWSNPREHLSRAGAFIAAQPARLARPICVAIPLIIGVQLGKVLYTELAFIAFLLLAIVSLLIFIFFDSVVGEEA